MMLLVISWLVTRLKLTFELSRLAFSRIRRIPEVRVRIKQPGFLQKSDWCWDDGKFMVLKADEAENKIIIRRFPQISNN